MIDIHLEDRIYRHNYLIEIFENEFTKALLNSYVSKWIKNFILSHLELCIAEEIPDHVLKAVAGKGYNIKKQMLLEIASVPFTTQKLFNAYREYLPEKVKSLMDELIWCASLSFEEAEKFTNEKIYNKHKQANGIYYQTNEFELKNEYNFFITFINRTYYYQELDLNDYFVTLPAALRVVLSYYYKAPKNATFHPIIKLEKTKHTYSSEANIHSEISKALAYRNQNLIKTSTKGKVVASTLGKMQRATALEEFYPDSKNKMLKAVKTNLLAGMLIKYPSGANLPTAMHEFIKLLFNKQYRNTYNCTDGILNHLRGIGRIDEFYIQDSELTIITIFEKLPIEEWISARNLQDYAKYNFYDLTPIRKSHANEKLYYPIKEEDRKQSYNDKKFISRIPFLDVIISPYLFGNCFLFAAFGLMDLAYNIPDLSTPGTSGYSPYDELKYIKLNKLGAYVLGISDTYEASENVSKSSIELSDKSLTIVIDEADHTAPILLRPYAQRASPNRYKTSFSYFLSFVSDKKTLEDKITLFKQTVKADIPENWNQFFDDLRKKIDPVKKLFGYNIFQIPPNNKDLMGLIAKDAILQKLCLKAEGYHIIIKNSDLNKFKNRLQEFGYLMT